MAERVIEERWVQCSPKAMEARLDVLRRRADHLAMKIDQAPPRARSFDEQEYAALMWAISELIGIGEEVRGEQREQMHTVSKLYRKAKIQIEHLTTVTTQLRASNTALKTENHLLRQAEWERNKSPQAAAAVDPAVANSHDTSTRATGSSVSWRLSPPVEP